MDNTYHTFWKRFLAGCVDAIVLTIIGFGTSMITMPNNEVFTSLSALVDNGVWLVYSIYLHGRYGQTLGKMLLKIKVVSTTGEKISYLQALKRDIVYIFMALVALASLFTHKEDYAKYNESVAYIEGVEVTSENFDAEEFDNHLKVTSDVWGSPIVWLGFASMAYFFLEIITMLTNKKRRAIHDFIAGTEVRRIE